MAGAFDCTCQLALMLRRRSRDPSGNHLALIVDVAVEHLNVLVVDVFDFIFSEEALSLFPPLTRWGYVAYERLALFALL